MGTKLDRAPPSRPLRARAAWQLGEQDAATLAAARARLAASRAEREAIVADLGSEQKADAAN